MFRRAAVGRRGPGLIGAAARTAVVAGTATAVSTRVYNRQMDRRQDQYDQEQAAAAQQQYQIDQAAQQAVAAQQAQAPAAPPAPAPGQLNDAKIQQLQKLGELQKQGVLTPEEFAAEKAKLLAT
jgi:hypothetical protein